MLRATFVVSSADLRCPPVSCQEGGGYLGPWRSAQTSRPSSKIAPPKLASDTASSALGARDMT
jgi:hypothetical protein